jgi:hypothetical protein
MRAFVFTDKALAKDASRFVWLSIDTEKAERGLHHEVSRQGLAVVLRDRSEVGKIVMRGSRATVGQLEKLFTQAANAGTGSRKGASETLARADALYGSAATRTRAGLSRGAGEDAGDAPDYSRAADAAALVALHDEAEERVRAVRPQALEKLRTGPSAANLAGIGSTALWRSPKGCRRERKPSRRSKPKRAL